MFGKLRRTAELNSEGLGMGLMICQKLVELNKGTISVKSDGIDKGSVFTFTMDMKRVPQYSIEDESKKVMIVHFSQRQSVLQDESQPYNSKKLDVPNKDYAELLEEDKEEYDQDDEIIEKLKSFRENSEIEYTLRNLLSIRTIQDEENRHSEGAIKELSQEYNH